MMSDPPTKQPNTPPFPMAAADSPRDAELPSQRPALPGAPWAAEQPAAKPRRPRPNTGTIDLEGVMEAVYAEQAAAPTTAVPTPPKAPQQVQAVNTSAARRMDEVLLQRPQVTETAGAQAVDSEPAERLESCQLLWLDAHRARRIRDHKPWQDLLDEVDDLDDALVDALSDVIGAPAGDPDLGAEIWHLLAKGPRRHFGEFGRIFSEAFRRDGKFVPPLMVCSGELYMHFDACRQLAMLIEHLRPLAAGEPRLAATLKATMPYTKLDPLPAALARELHMQLLAAYLRGQPNRTRDNLILPIERALLAERAFDECEVFGECCAGAGLRPRKQGQTGSGEVMVYVPPSLTQRLPRFRAIEVVVVAEMHARQQQSASAEQALRPLALARVDRD